MAKNMSFKNIFSDEALNNKNWSRHSVEDQSDPIHDIGRHRLLREAHIRSAEPIHGIARVTRLTYLLPSKEDAIRRISGRNYNNKECVSLGAVKVRRNFLNSLIVRWSLQKNPIPLF